MKIQYSNTQDVVARSATNREPTSVKLPEGVNFFAFGKVGQHTIDVLPFLTTKDPSRANPHCAPGMAHYERTWFSHRNLGLDGRSSYVCLQETFKAQCPVCQYLRQNQDEELTKALRPQRRMLLAVIDRNDVGKGIQVWDAPYFKSFGERFTLKLKSKLYDNFFHLKGGLSLMLTVEERSFGAGKPFKDVVNIEMVPRKEDYDDSMITQVPCLDDLLIRLEYSHLKRILEQEPEPAEEAPPIQYSKGTPAPKAAPAPTKAPAKVEPKVTREPDVGPGDFVKHEALGDCAVLKLIDTDEGKAVWVRDQKGTTHKHVGGQPILLSQCSIEE